MLYSVLWIGISTLCLYGYMAIWTLATTIILIFVIQHERAYMHINFDHFLNFEVS